MDGLDGDDIGDTGDNDTDSVEYDGTPYVDGILNDLLMLSGGRKNGDAGSNKVGAIGLGDVASFAAFCAFDFLRSANR